MVIRRREEIRRRVGGRELRGFRFCWYDLVWGFGDLVEERVDFRLVEGRDDWV